VVPRERWYREQSFEFRSPDLAALAGDFEVVDAPNLLRNTVNLGTDLQSLSGADSFFQNGANFGLGGSAVAGCAYTQGTVCLFRQIADS
jgi:hypothetical protein